ncbi:ERI1 exoribonuclease 2 [Thalassophryne amazonica]|uniref:ERI1 exoribonuclease 2 n=1 Tax=Thalassophryne amazonica TaxID=390379 RepID=UPI001471CB0A|nr:ERI1 exoribonuclease 2 [Thalassophryne amazonica]
MSTKKLAKELGFLRQRCQSSSGLKTSVISNQVFSYLIVIDFESTCWREKNNRTQEIIEFPAVLLNTSTGEVESEFHTYVQPQEHPILSQFCTELTGITQTQVEAGIPLHICLSRFSRWLQTQQLQMGFGFPNKKLSLSQKSCTFLTWSDWDLGVCLQYECKRKQIHKPDVLNSWIDLRSTYRLFYNRKPKGLNGALQDLGIQFSGREHSGLDDAQNTARLAARMMRDGCVMTITRSLERTLSVAKPMFGNTCPTNKENLCLSKVENMLTTNKTTSSTAILPISSCSEKIVRNLDRNTEQSCAEELVQVCTLVSAKTLLNGRTMAVCITNPASVKVNCLSPHGDGVVLCSTTLGCPSNMPPPSDPSRTRTEGFEEEEDLFVEPEERCSSYDAVVLEAGVFSEERDVEYMSDFDSGCCLWDGLDNSHSPEGRCTLKNSISTMMSTDSNSPSLKTRFHPNVSPHLHKMQQRSSVTLKPVTLVSDSYQHSQALDKSHNSHKNCKTNIVSPFTSKTFVPEKTSTPNVSFVRRKTNEPCYKRNKASFTIYSDAATGDTSCGRLCPAPRSVLSSVSINTFSSINCSTTSATPRITSPLCACGRRTKRQIVSNGGPNHGRGFYCCPVRRSSGGGRIHKGCQFFKWESALIKGSTQVSPAGGSSVSLCQMNSAVLCPPAQRSKLR